MTIPSSRSSYSKVAWPLALRKSPVPPVKAYSLIADKECSRKPSRPTGVHRGDVASPGRGPSARLHHGGGSPTSGSPPLRRRLFVPWFGRCTTGLIARRYSACPAPSSPGNFRMMAEVAVCLIKLRGVCELFTYRTRNLREGVGAPLFTKLPTRLILGNSR